jgi:hypothetical protein
MGREFSQCFIHKGMGPAEIDIDPAGVDDEGMWHDGPSRFWAVKITQKLQRLCLFQSKSHAKNIVQ